MLDSIFDQITLRKGFYNSEGTPHFTTGTIVTGALMRGALVMIVGFWLWNWRGDETTYFITIALLWAYVAYPAYRQYSVFNDHVKHFEITTLCGQCRHFNPTAQTCFRYDEHVSNEYIPCEGLDWEPR